MKLRGMAPRPASRLCWPSASSMRRTGRRCTGRAGGRNRFSTRAGASVRPRPASGARALPGNAIARAIAASAALSRAAGGVGLVRRERRAEDEHSARMALTQHGEALRSSASCRPPAIQAAMALNDEDLAQLRGAVQAVAAAVRTAPPQSPPNLTGARVAPSHAPHRRALRAPKPRAGAVARLRARVVASVPAT